MEPIWIGITVIALLVLYLGLGVWIFSGVVSQVWWKSEGGVIS